MSIAAWNMKLPLDSNGRPKPALASTNLGDPLNSATIISTVNSWGGGYPLSTTVTDQPVGSPSGGDYNHPVFFAKSTDPLFTVAQGTSGGAFQSGGPFTIRIPQAARPARGGDGHLCVIQPDGVTEYDLWDVTSDAGSTTRLINLPTGGGTIYARGLGLSSLTGDGRNTGNGDATAAKFGLLAGVFRGEELAAQDINHALWWSMKGHNNTFVFPALASGGSGGFDSANAPPMGSRFFLDYSFAEVEALPIPRYRKTITHAMREYGAIFGDATGNTAIDLQPLSGTSYTALGLADPFRTYMTAQGVTGTVDWRTGVDYVGKLKVCSAGGSKDWPLTVSKPVQPTGLTTQNGGPYRTDSSGSNRLYIGLGSASVPADVKSSPTGTTVNNVIVAGGYFDYLEIQDGTSNFWVSLSTIAMNPSNNGYTPFNIDNQNGAGVGAPGPSVVVVDSCAIKNAIRQDVRPADEIHIEGIHPTVVNTLWIKNSFFTNNSLCNLALQNWGSPSDFSCRNVVIENNIFDPPVDYDQSNVFYSIHVREGDRQVGPNHFNHGDPMNVIIRNNVCKGYPPQIDPFSVAAGCKAYNNVDENGVLWPSFGV